MRRDGAIGIAIIASMFISLMQSNPQFYFAVVLVVVVSICLHELAHGFAAIAVGDRTPEEAGHLTMNPLVHMGPISLVMLAVTGFSWGMMPVDPTRMRGRYAESIVAVAGPLTNLALAFVAMTALGLWARFGTVDRANHMVDNAYVLLVVMGVYNLVLCALNLIPVPPLDGSRIAANFSSGYRRWMSDPTMSGVFLALTFAVLFGAGTILVPRAQELFGWYVGLVGGM